MSNRNHFIFFFPYWCTFPFSAVHVLLLHHHFSVVGPPTDTCDIHKMECEWFYLFRLCLNHFWGIIRFVFCCLPSVFFVNIMISVLLTSCWDSGTCFRTVVTDLFDLLLLKSFAACRIKGPDVREAIAVWINAALMWCVWLTVGTSKEEEEEEEEEEKEGSKNVLVSNYLHLPLRFDALGCVFYMIWYKNGIPAQN